MSRVVEAWKKFEMKVVPNDADEVQRAEMRGAFFAGMFQHEYFMLSAVNRSNTEEIAETRMKELHDELSIEIEQYSTKSALDVYRDNER